MNIILLAVSSINGKITSDKNSDIYMWTSKEDKEIFFSEINNAEVICMGSKTYDSARHLMVHKKGRVRIVFTRNKKRYKNEEIPGCLEFTTEAPKKIIAKYKQNGVRQVLVVGGGEINSLFLKQKLISKIYLTIEPVILGKGKPLIKDVEAYCNLKLESAKKLNKKGTMRLIYKVV
ncbi:MAG: dihydrofolate reductase [Candidatus Levybacteria bacterium]|nr:dihydrofolate reductase [Candidatus Levybacteria bacterium]MBP9815074.1 dihydrofolate reductase [Candidatus Levybacteria bacterium]